MSTQAKLYQCRLCLTKTATRVNIFGGDFPKMLEILTSIKVSQKYLNLVFINSINYR